MRTMRVRGRGREVVFIAVLALTAASSCDRRKGAGETTAVKEIQTFSLAWSEYPSWSTFGVAHEAGIINGRKGDLGPIEEKWGVDIELKEAEYDPCLVMYGAGQCDAVCITNMDVLNPSLAIRSVAVLPTSTSYGADACIVSGEVNDVKDLEGKKVYGLAKTVSEYCFVRNLEILGEKESDYAFTNMDPGAAATAMQQKQAGYDAIVVWNPFVLETLNNRADTKVLFDSTSIPGEIIDMVVVAQSSLDKPKGKEFACAVVDTFYAVSERIEDPATGDDTLVALGEKFSHLGLDSMKKVVQQTRFYKTPAEGRALFTGADLPGIMEKVVTFCVRHDIVPQEPKVGYGDKAGAADAMLRFDPSYMQAAAAKR
jgi:NitT/TauT family transport system substrate-binding protein